ncbi:MAG: hypothetical protein B6244_12050 [Candidatus Cloacimonetes bacterium 4572_55]|nr:MAG: hypothetical protein B6244_12050 [Candidatus Cloacimonetes bacterium 4572_55]
MPLTKATTGKDMIITAINGGRRMKSRLAAMGILPGQLLRIVGSSGGGQLIVKSNGSNIAIGKGISRSIYVI